MVFLGEALKADASKLAALEGLAPSSKFFEISYFYSFMFITDSLIFFSLYFDVALD